MFLTPIRKEQMSLSSCVLCLGHLSNCILGDMKIKAFFDKIIERSPFITVWLLVLLFDVNSS